MPPKLTRFTCSALIKLFNRVCPDTTQADTSPTEMADIKQDQEKEKERQEGEEEHAAGTELWLHTCCRCRHRILLKTWSAQRQPRSTTARQTCRRASESRTRELLSPSRVFVTCPLSAKAFSRSATFAWQLLSSICSCSRVCHRKDRPVIALFFWVLKLEKMVQRVKRDDTHPGLPLSVQRTPRLLLEKSIGPL